MLQLGLELVVSWLARRCTPGAAATATSPGKATTMEQRVPLTVALPTMAARALANTMLAVRRRAANTGAAPLARGDTMTAGLRTRQAIGAGEACTPAAFLVAVSGDSWLPVWQQRQEREE